MEITKTPTSEGRQLGAGSVAALAAGLALVAIGCVFLTARFVGGQSEIASVTQESVAGHTVTDPLYYFVGSNVVAVFNSAEVVDEISTASSGKALVWEIDTEEVVGDFYREDFNGASQLRVVEPIFDDGSSAFRNFLDSDRGDDQLKVVVLHEILAGLDVSNESKSSLSFIDVGTYSNGSLALDFARPEEDEILNTMIGGRPDAMKALQEVISELRDYYSTDQKVGPALSPFVHLLAPKTDDRFGADVVETDQPEMGLIMKIEGSQSLSTSGTLIWILDQNDAYLAGVELDGYTPGYLEPIPVSATSVQVIVVAPDGTETRERVELERVNEDGGLVLSFTAEDRVALGKSLVVDAAGLESAIADLVDEQSKFVETGPSEEDVVGDEG